MLRVSFTLFILFTIATANSYQEWLNAQNIQYTQYKKSMDQAFSDMLKKDWEAFQSMSIPSPYKKPKPVVVPKIVKPVVTPQKEIRKSPLVKIKPKEQIKKIEPIKVVKKVKKTKDFFFATFDFYSIPMQIEYDKKTVFSLQTINKNSISKFWDMMSQTNYKKIITQINSTKDIYNLNDWAKYQLIFKLGKNIFQDTNKANLFTWFVLVKMNYDTKVGYGKNTIYLLCSIQHNLFQVSFFTLKNKKYYILTPNGKIDDVGTIYTYAGEYPKADKKLTFTMFDEVKLYTNIQTKSLRFQYARKNYEIKTEYSTDLVDFYKTYPQVDYTIYFTTKNSTPLSNSLLVKLAPLVQGKSEIEAVNLLLRFVQTSFKYKTDQKQFSTEKVMFPEETVNYPYSDCEDRSILFSYLVRNLLKIEVVGVKYKDHLATAVAFSSQISGDNFSYKGKKYTISDPTYVNANAGTTMPQYKKSSFKVIALQ